MDTGTVQQLVMDALNVERAARTDGNDALIAAAAAVTDAAIKLREALDVQRVIGR